MKTLLFALALFLLASCDNESPPISAGADPTRIVSIVAADGTRHDFRVELALTPQQQQQGLMNRTQMDKNAGMLFVFPRVEEKSFWMKNTLIPLDMIFIKKDGQIHKVHDSAKPNDLSSVHSDGPIYAVLEINGGVAKTQGIKAGDRVHHPFFGNALKTP